LALAGGGANRTILHVDQNEFTGATFWSFVYYATNALELFSGGRTVDWRIGTGNNHWKKP
jgi:hypothetical protein